MNQDSIIKIEGVSKSYDDILALNNITVDVLPNELFGFIGPDGAGKTSLLRILSTLLIPDSGNALVLDLDVVVDYKAIRNCLGYMPGRFSLYYDLSVEENLEFFATIFGTSIKENYDLIEKIYSHIEPFKNRKAGALSGGMKQKLALSCALIHRPRILILDEPTTGVDAISRIEFWELLKELKKEGITIVISTPYMDEAAMCDRVAFIQKGNILTINTPEAIVQDFQREIIAVQSNNNFNLVQSLRKYPYTNSAYIFGQDVHYTERSMKVNKKRLEEYLRNEGIEALDMRVILPNIEDCFIESVELINND